MKSRRVWKAVMALAIFAPCARSGWAIPFGRICPIIYGEDDRKEVYQSAEEQKKQAASVVALFQLQLNPNAKSAKLKLKMKTLREAMTLCENEPFGAQTPAAFCSGALVGPDIVLTAGHCFAMDSTISPEEACRRTSFVFGFAYTSEKADPETIKTEDIYECKALVKSRVVAEAEDWAIVRLDRPVKNRAPLAVNTKQAPEEVKKGMAVYTIGHPLGLPAKVAGGGKVTRVYRGKFDSNLDIFGGNSGSPVFNADTQLIEGIVGWNPEQDLRVCLDREHGATVYRSKRFADEEGASGSTLASAFAKDLEEAIEASQKALEAEEKLKAKADMEQLKEFLEELEKLPKGFDGEKPKPK